MALYTILLGLSIFMIVLVMAVVKKIFFTWKEDNEIESMIQHFQIGVQRPAVSCTIIVERCLLRRRKYLVGSLLVYDVITKSDISLTKRNYNHMSNHRDLTFNAPPCEKHHYLELTGKTVKAIQEERNREEEPRENREETERHREETERHREAEK